MKKLLSLMFVSTLFISSCSSSDSSGGNNNTNKEDTILFDPYGKVPEVNIQEHIKKISDSTDPKYNNLFSFNNIEAMGDLSTNYSVSMTAYKFSITNEAGTLGEKTLTLSNQPMSDNTNVIQIENIKNYTVDELLKIKLEDKSAYQLYDNKLVDYSYINFNSKYLFEENSPNVPSEYTKLKIQDLKGVKYHIDGPGVVSSDQDEYLTFSNPNSKLYIFEGTSKGKKFADAIKEEILLKVSSSNKAKDNTLASIVEAFATDGHPYSFDQFINYNGNLYIGLDEVGEYNSAGNVYNEVYAFLNINTKAIEYFKRDQDRRTYTPTDKPKNPSEEFKNISLIEDSNIKNKEVNVNINSDTGQSTTVSKTIDKCYRFKVNYQQYFGNYHNNLIEETLYCVDTEKNIYEIDEFMNNEASMAFYNYEAMVENNTFVKNLIQKKLSNK